MIDTSILQALGSWKSEKGRLRMSSDASLKERATPMEVLILGLCRTGTMCKSQQFVTAVE